MARAKNTPARVSKAASNVEKTAKADTSGLVLIARNDAIVEAARERNIRNADIGELARKYAARAVERIAQIMESDNNREALSAAVHLLDRAYGKPSGLAEEKNSMNEVMLGLRESLRTKLARLAE